MDIISLSDAPAYDSNRVVAQPFLEGSQSNVRLIRLSPGQALPPHTHGSSDLMIFAVEGEGTLDTDDGTVPFGAGSLAFYRGDEELRVANKGQTGPSLANRLAVAAPMPLADPVTRATRPASLSTAPFPQFRASSYSHQQLSVPLPDAPDEED